VSFDEVERSRFRVSLLEFNAEPAIEMTSPRLRWILEELFQHIAEVAVKPFVSGEPLHSEGVDGSFEELECCLSIDLNR
jgi:tubulin---tyrosine ligase